MWSSRLTICCSNSTCNLHNFHFQQCCCSRSCSLLVCYCVFIPSVASSLGHFSHSDAALVCCQLHSNIQLSWPSLGKQQTQSYLRFCLNHPQIFLPPALHTCTFPMYSKLLCSPRRKVLIWPTLGRKYFFLNDQWSMTWLVYPIE